MSLKEYVRKRNFRKTAEPKGGRVAGAGRHRFVIQKHDASRLHYDFRLEIGGTLKSWAVPKGIPFAKGEKRLAVQVEDHPVSYIDFEGTIPKGQYGGGTVMVWDRGTFETPSSSPAQELDSGKLHFTLSGSKLKGEWYLVRMRGGSEWLLIRGGENMRPVSKKLDDTSALSRKSMAELAAGKRVWNSKPREAQAPQSSPRGQARPAKKKNPALPPFFEPMKARLMASPPSGDWIYEIKFDGFRALAFKSGAEVRLLSRNQKDFNGKFPEVAAALGELAVEDVILDGEIVALDPKGVSSFQLLQAYELNQQRPPIFFYAFDLLWLEGEDLRTRPLTERKAALERLLSAQGKSIIRYSAPLGGDGAALLKKARKLGVEGLIGKRPDSVYETGRRSGAWIKLKLHAEQEFVIGGFTEPEGSRSHFGALLVGYYEDRELKFSGKVGTGFNQKLLKTLYGKLEPIARRDCPFANLPEKKSSGRAARMTAAEMRRCHWVQPRLVCQLKFAEWTQDGKLRQPVFLGLREDKDAQDVTREKAK